MPSRFARDAAADLASKAAQLAEVVCGPDLTQDVLSRAAIVEALAKSLSTYLFSRASREPAKATGAPPKSDQPKIYLTKLFGALPRVCAHGRPLLAYCPDCAPYPCNGAD